jgi:phage shock protein PspC (stress-responsive transcriptional regulator)
MKRVVQINLGGHPITIDDDAYEQLSRYLKAIDRSFEDLDGHDEILQDIELRIAELFQERLKGRLIVSMPDVDAIIEVMGKPETFREEEGAAGAKQTHHRQQTKESSKFRYRPGKKLYRDPDNKIIGGVCAGLAAYFGIPDPVWVRLFFVVLFFTGGFGVLTYLVLLVIVPNAVTSADKLAMRGEAVNIDTIAKAVEKQFQDLSDKLTEIGEDWRRKSDK